MLRRVLSILIVLGLMVAVAPLRFEYAKAAANIVVTVSQDKKYVRSDSTETITATVNVRNSSDVVADHVRVDIPKDDSIRVLKNTISNGGQDLGDKLVWLLPDMAVGSELNLTYQYKLNLARDKRTYYVSTSGNDGWSGLLDSPNATNTDGPLASILGARDKIRQYKTTIGLNMPIEVKIRGGRYYFESEVAFTGQDSGTDEFPIVYTAYTGENPIFVGGRRVTSSWALKPGNSTIYKTNLGVLDWKPNNLIVNDVSTTRAKDPNTGYFLGEVNIDPRATVPSVSPSPIMANGSEYPNHEYFKKDANDTLSPTSKNLSEMRVSSFVKWTQNNVPVLSVDGSSGIVKTFKTLGYDNLNYAYNGGYSPSSTIGGRVRYVLENVYEKLDIAGEWYYDSANGDLYYWPREGENIQNAVVEISKTPVILSLSGVSNVNIEGIKFTATQTKYKDLTASSRGIIEEQPAINLVDSNDIRISSCSFYVLGARGIAATLSSNSAQYSRIFINKNEFVDIGTSPIYLSGITSLNRGFSAIVNNKLINSGVINATRPLRLSNMVGTLVENNLVDGNGYSGIHLTYAIGALSSLPEELQYGSVAPMTMVAKNRVKNVMTKINDGSGIYVYQSKGVPISVDNNIVSDIVPTTFHYDSEGMLHGIYLDESASNVSITNNLNYRVSGGLMSNRGGSKNRFVNNIVADNSSEGFNFSYLTRANVDELTIPRYDHPEDAMLIKNNIVQFNNDYNDSSSTDWVRFRMKWVYNATINGQSVSYPAIRYAGKNLFYRSKTENVTARNIRTNEGAYNDQNNANIVGELAAESESAYGNPLFVNPSVGDYRLQSNSPAFGLGFKQIDFSGVGTDW